MSRLNYEEKDAAGCTIESPDFTQCEKCLYKTDGEPIKCLIYENMKPARVIYDKKPCTHRRTE